MDRDDDPRVASEVDTRYHFTISSVRGLGQVGATMRGYVAELWIMTVRSVLLALLVASVGVFLLGTRATVTAAFAVVTATTWLTWWLVTGGRNHVEQLIEGPLGPPPRGEQVAATRFTAARIALPAPVGSAIVLVPLVLAAWIGAAASIVAGAVSGSLLGLATIRAIEVTALVRWQRRTSKTILHQPGRGPRQRHRFFAQPSDLTNK